MHDWWIWRSDDLVTWKQVGTLIPEDTYWGKPTDQCWAVDAISGNGKYFLYFSRGPAEIGVVVSDTPYGPWKDPIGKPLIAEGSTPTIARDPALFQEADGTTYIVFGVFDFYIAKLNEDMVSLAETPRLLTIENKQGPYGLGKTDDKPYLHKKGNKYYLSWGCYYSASENIYGPYMYKDTIIKANNLANIFKNKLLVQNLAHQKNVSAGNEQYVDFVTLDRHASFFEWKGQSYFVCNDQAWPGTQMFFRDSVIGYLKYRKNGDIETVDITPIGVGQYDGAAQIDASNYFASQNASIRESSPFQYEVWNTSSEFELDYPNIRNLKAGSKITIRFWTNGSNAVFEIYSLGTQSELLTRLLCKESEQGMKEISSQFPRIKNISGIKIKIKCDRANAVGLSSIIFDSIG
jgi:hypothetical protein